MPFFGTWKRALLAKVSGPFHPLYDTKSSNRSPPVVYGSITLKFFRGLWELVRTSGSTAETKFKKSVFWDTLVTSMILITWYLLRRSFNALKPCKIIKLVAPGGKECEQRRELLTWPKPALRTPTGPIVLENALLWHGGQILRSENSSYLPSPPTWNLLFPLLLLFWGVVPVFT